MLDELACLQLLPKVLKLLTDLGLTAVGTSTNEALERLFYLSVGMLVGSGDPLVRKKIGADVLPLFFLWDQKEQNRSSTEPRQSRTRSWCQGLWEIFKRVHDTSFPVHLREESAGLRKEIPAVLCRTFDYFMGLDSSSPPRDSADASETNVKANSNKSNLKKSAKKPSTTSAIKSVTAAATTFLGSSWMGLDLRIEKTFWDMIQSGLKNRDQDGVTAKYSVFLMKRVVDFSSRYQMVLDSETTSSEWSSYFKWDGKVSAEWAKLWEEYFLLYETIGETVPHLFEPLLHKLNSILAPRFSNPSIVLHPSWWMILTQIGSSNRLIVIRKKVLEHLMTTDIEGGGGGSSTGNLNRLAQTKVLCDNPDFLLNDIFERLDQSALYLVPGLGNFVSPFGEKLRVFMVHILKHFETSQQRDEFLRKCVKRLTQFTTRLGAVYVMLGLADFVDFMTKSRSGDLLTPLGAEDFANIRLMFFGEVYIAVWTRPEARMMLRQLCVKFAVHMASKKALNYEDVSMTLWLLLGYGRGEKDERIEILTEKERKMEERKWVREWLLEGGFQSPSSASIDLVHKGDWLVSNLREAIRGYLDTQQGRFHILRLCNCAFRVYVTDFQLLFDVSASSFSSQVQQAQRIALMLSFLLPPGFSELNYVESPNASQFQFALEPFTLRLTRLRSGAAYATRGVDARTIFLLKAILQQTLTLLGDAEGELSGSNRPSDTRILKVVYPILLESAVVEDVLTYGLSTLFNPCDRQPDLADEICGVFRLFLVGVGELESGVEGSVLGVLRNFSSIKELFLSWHQDAWGVLLNTGE
jgi:hypothetical protein